ncbi:MAG: ATP-binding protein [Pseudomonadales bacterium]|nr:ATP-binding protein [Pseudomonadales bacterium]
MTADEEIKKALQRIAAVLEAHFPLPASVPDLQAAIAFRWLVQRGVGRLEPIKTLAPLALEDLLGIDQQKKEIDRNTQQFLRGMPANNVLLTGARGVGKSSLIRALLHRYAAEGLRVIEVQRDHLTDLPEILSAIRSEPHYATLRFIIFCDDLTFSDEEPAYKALKTALDGSLAAPDSNVLIYATSNRRHLLPEYMQDNLAVKMVGDELHPGEAIEEKVSLSERFGLWLSFYPFTQDEYLLAVTHWLMHYGVHATDALCTEACAFATQRGSRSGRVAVQFARDTAGKQSLQR